ncbi:MAG: M20/M25/M40 family metallo-hydrolase [Verrucomicrobium sp.]|nr:M20/M25/M40 family metallo-hydrolase [Verrucomicrobium sp.]
MSASPALEAAALLERLVAIPSLSGEEGPAADFLQSRLEAWFPGQVRRMGHNLLVDLSGPQPGPALLLCSHIDTVSPAAGWTRPPYAATVEGERIYGLGANDAGASVVSMILAAREYGAPAAGRLLVCLAAEEEAGSGGFRKVEPELPRYDAAVFGEPTDLGVAASMRGAMQAVLRSRGVACHASRPWEGRNAFDKLATDLAALRSLDLADDSPWRGATVEPTVVRGGESANQIPALIETKLDIRTTPQKDNAWIRAEFARLGLEAEITADWRRPMHNPPGAPLPAAIRAEGAPEAVFNGTCDMAFATAPSVVWGPGRSERSHAADEFVERGEIARAVAAYGAVLRRYFSA